MHLCAQVSNLYSFEPKLSIIFVQDQNCNSNFLHVCSFTRLDCILMTFFNIEIKSVGCLYYTDSSAG